MVMAGRGGQMEKWEADDYKLYSDCPGSLVFVEEVFSLVTVQLILMTMTTFIIHEKETEHN
jgi:hypothetical protein